MVLRAKKKEPVFKVFAQAWSTHRFCTGSTISIRGAILFTGRTVSTPGKLHRFYYTSIVAISHMAKPLQWYTFCVGEPSR